MCSRLCVIVIILITRILLLCKSSTKLRVREKEKKDPFLRDLANVTLRRRPPRLCRCLPSISAHKCVYSITRGAAIIYDRQAYFFLLLCSRPIVVFADSRSVFASPSHSFFFFFSIPFLFFLILVVYSRESSSAPLPRALTRFVLAPYDDREILGEVETRCAQQRQQVYHSRY